MTYGIGNDYGATLHTCPVLDSKLEVVCEATHRNENEFKGNSPTYFSWKQSIA